MLEQIISDLSKKLDVSLDDPFVVEFMKSIKQATPSSLLVMEKDWEIYAEKLSARLKEEGQEKMEITLAFQSWAMNWMASQNTLIAGLLLMALAAGKEIENANGVPKPPVAP